MKKLLTTLGAVIFLLVPSLTLANNISVSPTSGDASSITVTVSNAGAATGCIGIVNNDPQIAAAGFSGTASWYGIGSTAARWGVGGSGSQAALPFSITISKSQLTWYYYAAQYGPLPLPTTGTMSLTFFEKDASSNCSNTSGAATSVYTWNTVTNYTLTYAAGANGSISGTSPQTVAAGGSGSAVTAVPDTGYSFTSWSDSSTANPRTDTSVSGNISVTASFSLIPPPPPTNHLSDQIAASEQGMASTTGFNIGSVTQWSADNLIKIFLGSGLAVLFGLRYWIVAMLIISAIVLFSFRGMKFFKTR